jgi:hypothetical protein
MQKITEIERFRLSGSSNLLPVLDLGEQALTGVFSRTVPSITFARMRRAKAQRVPSKPSRQSLRGL